MRFILSSLKSWWSTALFFFHFDSDTHIEVDYISCQFRGRNHWGGRGGSGPPVKKLNAPPKFLRSFLMNSVIM